MSMKILIAASEALPFAATGGLADVIGSLPHALYKNGVDVRVVIPMYPSVRKNFGDEIKFIKAITVKLSWRNQYCGIFESEYKGVKYYFIDNEYYFKRDGMYGYMDDGERYAFFSKAILEMLPHIDFYPDVLHTNDWQTALSAIYLKRHYCTVKGYENIKSLHTLHNIEYQGEYDFSMLQDVFDLSPFDAPIVDYKGRINLIKGALICCDKFSTVSPTYAEEIKTETYSHGLHHILNAHSDKIIGILNGIDTEYYKPATFDVTDISGKSTLKMDLQKEIGLPVNEDIPMIGMITRLVTHKGMDLIIHVIDEFMHDNVQFVVLGTGDEKFENFYRNLEFRYPDKVRAIISYDVALSIRIYSGSDIFLMPSKSEPCGLAQMISSQYGTVPLVRQTGGLYDSIKDYNPATGEGNGFTFRDYNAHDMLFRLQNAVDMYRNDKDAWNKLVKQVMSVDFSWNVSAEKYIKLYEELIN